MGRKRVLLILKSFDVFASQQPIADCGLSRITHPKILSFLDNRRKVHEDAINFCQDILQQKCVDWKPVLQSNLSHPIRDADLVVTLGGDGTLLQASHFIDDSIPVLEVNSDPTRNEEVEEFSEVFDATRSTGFLCAATTKNFEQMVDNILEGHKAPSKLSRMSISVNSEQLPIYALNDVLIAHACPATVSRFSFRIRKDGKPCSPWVNCRSSGLRVSTAAGSSAAMLSAGGFAMPILSKDLQYMVREPISSGAANSSLMHGIVKFEESMDTASAWYCKEEGVIYVDGSHAAYPIKHEDNIELSSNAPVLNVFLPNHLLP